MQQSLGDIGRTVQAPWRRFLDIYEPLRPDLYRFCRHLTGSPWEAEDVVQDAMARAFVTLGCLREPPASPRAWLFRVASNLWLNQVRRRRELGATEPPAESREPRAPREAAGTLLSQLSPQERAALVLEDVFEFPLSDVATILGTTTNAVKAALHRGRGRLLEAPEEPRTVVAPAVLDAFCAAFNARDIDRLTALLLDTASVELPGLVVEYGPEAARAGTFRGTLFGCPDEQHAALPPVHAEVHYHRGEPIMCWWLGDEVHSVVRAVVEVDRIARLTSYYHAPDVLEEVCRELELPYRAHGYGYWEQGA